MTGPQGSIGRGWLQRIRSLAAPKDRTQLREWLRDAARHGLLDGDALSMLEGVLDVADLQVRDIMVPHNQMICVHEDDPPHRVLRVAIESGHSRFPVFDADREAILGVLLAKDLLQLHFADLNDTGFDLHRLLRKTVFVPESKRVNVLLKELRASRNHLAIAVDEYGGIAGLVTIEDVIEQIVGDIDDEYDIEEEDIRAEGERQYSVRGTTRIDDFNTYFDAHLPDDEFDTVAGLVTQHFGRLPRRGEVAQLNGFEFRVVRADRRRVDSLRVTVPAPVAEDAADGEASA